MFFKNQFIYYLTIGVSTFDHGHVLSVDDLIHNSGEVPPVGTDFRDELTENLIKEFNPKYVVPCGEYDFLSEHPIDNEMELLAEVRPGKMKGFMRVYKIKYNGGEMLYVLNCSPVSNDSFVLLREGKDEKCIAQLLGVNLYTYRNVKESFKKVELNMEDCVKKELELSYGIKLK